MNLRFLLLGLVCCLVVVGRCDAGEAQSHPEVVVAFNPAFPGAESLAKYYADVRGIPADHLIGLKMAVTDDVTRADFDELLRDPLREVFEKRGWWEASTRVRYLVLIRGIPFRIKRTAQGTGKALEDEASVDSELAVMGMTGLSLPGPYRNPWYDKPEAFAEFTADKKILLTARLDGPDEPTVRRMIDDAIAVEASGLYGRAVIDLALKDGPYQEGETWLQKSAQIFRESGIPVYADRQSELIPESWPLPDTIFYYGWYTQDVDGAMKSESFKFKRGAIACHLHSFSAGTMRSADQHWVGPLLKHGAAVALGNVWEPYLGYTVHFDVLNRRILDGWTVGEAVWNATPGLSWMTLMVGDPLYRPFGKGIGSSLGEGLERDYAMYQGRAIRAKGVGAEGALKMDLLRLAEHRRNAHLMELIGLLSSQSGHFDDAAELFANAEAWYETGSDRIRMRIYAGDALISAGKDSEAERLLKAGMAKAEWHALPEFVALVGLLRRVAPQSPQ
ncbi:MAG: TIGR03790 family protein [Verrucomicrobiales bacterium]|nr:TIGR03790 family protein [Verrucomicrobiales bacterium]MCP5558769.1 TIGR03790 family protein [Verrucomicrobiaceae bacterium]